MKIAVLAVQGAFIEHEKKLEKLGASVSNCEKKKTWKRILTVWYFPAVRVRFRESC